MGIAQGFDVAHAVFGELVLRERMRRSGSVGPNSYKRLREALVDTLARILSKLDAASPHEVVAAAEADAAELDEEEEG